MEHLNAIDLARLVDEAPTEDERRHLAACPECAAEAAELRTLCEGLGGLPELRPPRGDWEVLQARLVSEGLVRGGSRLGQMATTPTWMKVAAAAVLFLSGSAAGGVLATRTVAVAPPGADAASPFLTASTVRSADEAGERLRLAERQYMDALVQYRQLMEQDGATTLPDPEERYAALEYMVQAGQAALRAAPADPFLNGLVASAVAEREMVLRRISREDGKDWY